MSRIALIAHNLRSTHNVGSLFRTAEGLGVAKLWLTGYTPHPATEADERLPHIVDKLTNQIHKTALGTEKMLEWAYETDIESVVNKLRRDGYTIAAIEQFSGSIPLHTYNANEDIAVIIGREVEGIEPEVLALCDVILEIPMDGRKESFNVVQAASMALYQLRFHR